MNTPDMAQSKARNCIAEGFFFIDIQVNNITKAGAIYSNTVAVAELE